MNYDQVTGVLRAVIPAAIAFAISKGWIADISASTELITSAAVAIAAAVWSVLNNKTGKVIR